MLHGGRAGVVRVVTVVQGCPCWDQSCGPESVPMVAAPDCGGCSPNGSSSQNVLSGDTVQKGCGLEGARLKQKEL